MREDRLRALRALRFAGRFDFEIDAATWDAIRESAPHLGRLSMERVKQELEKVMEQVARPSRTIERYRGRRSTSSTSCLAISRQSSSRRPAPCLGRASIR
jgi:hypothetical protein